MRHLQHNLPTTTVIRRLIHKLRTMTSVWTDVNSCLHLTNDSCIDNLKWNRQTIDASKITAKQQTTNHYNFYVLTTNNITKKLTNPNQAQRHKYHHLTTTLHLTLKRTNAQVVETSATNNSLSKDYLHPDDHTKQITTSTTSSTTTTPPPLLILRVAPRTMPTKKPKLRITGNHVR